MKKRFFALLLAVVMLVMAIPAFAGAEEVGYIVGVKNYANVRSKPSDSSSSKILGCVKLGAEVKVLEVSGAYTKVTCTNTRGIKVTGYVFTKFVSANPPEVGTVTVKSDCKVYKEASTKSAELGTVSKNEKLIYVQKPTSWYKVKYGGGFGFIRVADAEKESSSPSGTDTARSGYGYVTGNTVNIREKATKDSSKMGTAKKNEVYEIVATNGNWYKIKFGGNEYYISKSYFKAVCDSTGKKLTVVDCKESVNVRASASASGRKLGTAKLNESFTYLKTSGKYEMVIYNGKVGYIHKNYADVQ